MSYRIRQACLLPADRRASPVHGVPKSTTTQSDVHGSFRHVHGAAGLSIGRHIQSKSPKTRKSEGGSLGGLPPKRCRLRVRSKTFTMGSCEVDDARYSVYDVEDGRCCCCCILQPDIGEDLEVGTGSTKGQRRYSIRY